MSQQNDRLTPYGAWRSPIGAEMITAGQVGLSGPSRDGAITYWCESRPQEGGRGGFRQRQRRGDLTVQMGHSGCPGGPGVLGDLRPVAVDRVEVRPTVARTAFCIDGRMQIGPSTVDGSVRLLPWYALWHNVLTRQSGRRLREPLKRYRAASGLPRLVPVASRLLTEVVEEA